MIKEIREIYVLHDDDIAICLESYFEDEMRLDWKRMSES